MLSSRFNKKCIKAEMPLKITFLVRLSKVWFDIWYCLTDHQIVPGGSHGAPAHPECSPNVGAPTFPGCAVYSSSSSSSLTTTSLRGQRAHLRDRHLLPAQRHVLQRLLLESATTRIGPHQEEKKSKEIIKHFLSVHLDIYQ